MKKPLLLIATLILLLILVASVTVASAARSATQSPPSLEGVRWVLVSQKDTQGKTAPAVPGAGAYAEFAGGTVAGSTGCNRYTAPYQATGNSLKVGLTATTMMACADPIMAQEQAYLTNLQASAAYKIEGEQLSIADASGTTVLTYKAEKPTALVGEWVMTNYNNGTGGFQSAMIGWWTTALFDQQGQLTGDGGCNTYSATYAVDGDKIKISPPVSTKKACDPQVMAQENAYLAALPKAATYKVEGTKLTMRDASGAAMVAYAVKPLAPTATPAPPTAPGVIGGTSERFNDTVYLALRPAADAAVELVSLRLKPDGAAEFSRNFGKEQASTETGTWTETDDMVTVTLTDKDGAKLATPDVLKFKRDATYITLTDYDKAVWGENGLRLNQPSDMARRMLSAMITIDVSAGIPLDPMFISVFGGGEVDAGMLGRDCAGFVSRQPVVTVKSGGTAERFRMFFYSDGDPTLMVLTPKGELLCNDNVTDRVLDPYIEIKNPAPGNYRIWVGNKDKESLVPGALVLTTKASVDLGNFELGKLIKRPAIPVTTLQPTEPEEISPAIQAITEKLMQNAPALQPLAKAAPVQVTADGTLPLFRLPAAYEKGCAGLVTGAPSYAFRWPGKTGNLHVAFEGDGDSTLMVVATGTKQVWCNDDSAPDNVNPAIDILSPGEDLYLVYVGRTDPKKTITGMLTVSGGQGGTP